MPGRGYVWATEREGYVIHPIRNESETLRTEGIVFKSITTWGDHVLLDAGRRLLLRTSDWKVRWIPHVVGERLIQATTLTEDKLYVTYCSRNRMNFYVEPRMMSVIAVLAFHRYDLSQLESLGEPECGEEGQTCWISWWRPQ